MNYYLIQYQEDEGLKFPNHYSKVAEADNPKEAVKDIEGRYTITSIKMITNDQAGYTQLKNHLHNTLELTKGDIRKMVEEAIEDIVERRLDVFLEYNDGIQRVIDNAIREKSWSKHFWSDEKNLDDALQKRIVNEITNKLLKEIGLDVKIKRKNPVHVEPS